MKDYPQKYKEQVIRAIVKGFETLCRYEMAKMTVNMNRQKQEIEIVTEPHEKFYANDLQGLDKAKK